MKTKLTLLACLTVFCFCTVNVQAQKNNDKNYLNFQNALHTNLKETPENVIRAFGIDFPSALNINWSTEPGMWYVRCDDTGGYKCLTGYKSNGTKIFTARNLKSSEMPAAVATYCAESGNVSAGTIIQIEVPGELNFWRITTSTGMMIFISNSGMQTTCTINGFAAY